jgi:hypothetical protein
LSAAAASGQVFATASITVLGKNGKLVLVSEHLENVPATLKARYTYEFKGTGEYLELFELNENDKGFQPYVSGRFLRTPSAQH